MNNVYSKVANQDQYPFVLPQLPFAPQDFRNHLSEESFEYHYKKHHNTYVVNLNKLLEGHQLGDLVGASL